MDSTAETAPYGVTNHQQIAVTGDAWIRQPTQPIGIKKSSTNCCHRRRMKLRAHTAPKDSEMTNELLSRVTRGFDSPRSPRD
jgi:hypothetical protein